MHTLDTHSSNCVLERSCIWSQSGLLHITVHADSAGTWTCLVRRNKAEPRRAILELYRGMTQAFIYKLETKLKGERVKKSMLTLIQGLSVLNCPDPLSWISADIFPKGLLWQCAWTASSPLFSERAAPVRPADYLLLWRAQTKKICIVYSGINALHHSLGACKHGWLLPIANRYQWERLGAGSSENYYHQTQQWCCWYLSLDSPYSDFAKARCPFILLQIAISILSAGATRERSQRDNSSLPYTRSNPWADFHPCFALTAFHLYLHASQEPLCHVQGRRKQDPPYLKGSPCPLPPPPLPPAQLQVKGACWHQREGWEFRSSVITEITEKVTVSLLCAAS